MSGGRGRGSVVGSVEDDLSVSGDFFFNSGVLLDVCNIKHIDVAGDCVLYIFCETNEFQTFESAVDEKVYVALFCHCVFCEGTEENCFFHAVFLEDGGERDFYCVDVDMFFCVAEYLPAGFVVFYGQAFQYAFRGQYETSFRA